MFGLPYEADTKKEKYLCLPVYLSQLEHKYHIKSTNIALLISCYEALFQQDHYSR